MQLTPEVSVSALTVFLQGLISFFSPCVFPILPLYFGFLSGSAAQLEDPSDPDGKPSPKKSRLIVNTFFFVLGISFAFFLLALGFTAFGQFFHQYSGLISKIGGIIVILFGCYQLGVFGDSMLMSRERRIHLDAEKLSASPLTAILMGFTFSFGWTPCVGPALTSALLMASSSDSAASGFLLVGLYTLGFTLPFLVVSFFAEKAMDFFYGKGKLLTTVQKIGGVLMIVMGVLMFTGYFTNAANPALPETEQSQAQTDDAAALPEADAPAEESGEREKVMAPDIALVDREGNPVSLKDYIGKTVFLNFWGTWCGPCRNEMPDIQKLYEAYGENTGDVVILAVAAPNYYMEGPLEGIVDYLEKNDYTYPVVYDMTGEGLAAYSISSFPTTYMIDDEGYAYGYVSGAISYETMEQIIQMAQSKDYSKS